MPKFAKGDSVLYVETNEPGIVVDVYDLTRGKQIYKVRWIKTGDVSDELESRLEAERKLDGPFDCLLAGVFGAFVDFARLNTQYKIENTSINTISSLKASRTIFKPYQYKTLLKFLNSDSRRLLIGDEVGLGKTIEAGHIMLELLARKEFRSALIVCPKSLMGKWKDELEGRFDLRFKIYEHKHDLIADIESRRPIFGIISYRNVSQSNAKGVCEALEEASTMIDLLVCDEAHTVRNDGTAVSKGVRRITDLSKAVLFMTATPIMISEDNLFTLLNLLDPDQFKSSLIFRSILNANKPFVAAISDINAKRPFKEIASRLKNSQIRYVFRGTQKDDFAYVPVTVEDDYKDNPLFSRIISTLETAEENDANRVRIQYDISSLSILSTLFSRTTKRDVTTDWSQAIRVPKTVIVDLDDEELDLHDGYLQDKCIEKGYNDLSEANPLWLSGIRKILSSSIIAHALPWEMMDEYPHDSKFEALLKIVREVITSQQKKLIIFATNLKTLGYLQKRLGNEGYRSLLIDGSVSDRYNIIKQFQYDPEINILLSSEVGGEGLDMQFCDSMVNYDLPWNPMVVEQRIGRIDRFGQTSKFVYIYNLLVEGTLQEKIYGRLLNRIGIFKECIGDLEAILDGFLERMIGKEHNVNFTDYLSRELEAPGITEEEVERKLESMQKAFEQVKFDAERLSTGLKDAMTNDVYFKDEINKINETGRYITEVELNNYVRSIIDNVLKTCRFSFVDDNVYRISVLKTDPKALTNFLVTNKPVSASADYTDFVNKTRDASTIEFTFDQQYAYNNRNFEYINAFHPLVQAITEYYKKHTVVGAGTFKMQLRSKDIEDKLTLHKGQYVLGVYLIDIQRELFHSVKHNQILVPLVFDCDRELFLDSKDDSDLLFARVQEKSVYAGFAPSISAKVPLQTLFTERITEIQDHYRDEYAIRAESSKMVLKKRTQANYERQIQNLENRIRKIEWQGDASQQKILLPWKANLKNLKDEMARELDALDANKVSVRPNKLISLSLLNIV